MNTPLHALLAEDSEDDAKLMVYELERGGYDVTLERVETAEGLRHALAGERWDIILCDFSFPHFSGQEALRIVKESGLDLPFIYVSGKIGEDVAVEAMKSGAHDYVMKNNLARLAPAVRRELRDAQERQQRRHAEEAMRVSEHKHRHLFETMSDAAFLVERTRGRIIDTNRQAEALLGQTRAEILGMNQERLFAPGRDRDSSTRLEESIGEGAGKEAEVIRKDGAIIPVHISTSLVELYGRECLLALIRDISERKRAEAERERLLRDRLLILESTSEGIYGTDLQGRCTFINRAAATLLGREVAEVLGLDMHSLIHDRRADGTPYPVAECPIQDTLSKGLSCRIDTEFFHRKDGSPFPVEYASSPIIENGEIKGAVVAFSDLTEKKRLEARFLRAQRLESIGKLTGGLAHDLNNILAPIMMCAPQLRQEVTTEHGLSLIHTLETCAMRGADVVKHMLTFAKGKEGHRVPLRPAELVDEIARFIHETFPKTITLVIDVREDCAKVSGDATQLHQILLNLAVNARDAMPDGGTLRIAAANVLVTEAEAMLLPGGKPGPYVLLTVTDTGGGMPPEVAEQIFDPFFTTKEPEKGTGLGLSTILGIIKSHGGSIQFTSETGHGTQFMVYLPAMPDAAGGTGKSMPAQ